MKITKRLHWHMGHRVPNHKSVCRNVHGHTYTAEITLEGDVVAKKGISEEGMVMDFSDIKKIAKDFIDEQLDHGFMVYNGDTVIIDFLESIDSKLCIVDFIPTAEEIAAFLFDVLDAKYKDIYETGLRLYKIRLYETPNSFADYCPYSVYERQTLTN